MNAPVLNILRKVFAAGCLAALPTLASAQTVKAVDDIAHTQMNKPVTINVIQNDNNAAGGGLILDRIVLVNNGKAKITDNQIEFTPDPDYKGAAMINYTVRGVNTQQYSSALVYVDISERPLLEYQEMKVFVEENKRSRFTLPLGYDLVSAPQNGAVNFAASEINKEWSYRPNPGFRGTEFVTFSTTEGGETKLFDVEFEVLKKQPDFVFPDVKSIRIGTPYYEFNVLENDSINRINEVVNYSECTGGTIATKNDGSVKFTPNLPNGGKATFTYTAKILDGQRPAYYETTQVVIFVSDYLPSKDQYSLVCSGEALVISYPSPFKDFRFIAANETTELGGNVKFYPSITRTIGLSEVVGDNILLYTPPLGISNETDNFFIKYCVGNNCSNYLNIKVRLQEPGRTGDQCYGGNCVWPGDANTDGEVNIIDLYAIANAIGEHGNERQLDVLEPSAAIEWYAHTSKDWGKLNYNDADIKHADTNGDGDVTVEDVQAIIQNYNNHSTITPTKTVEDNAVEVQLVSGVSSARYGDLLEMVVYVGSAQNPVYNAKGLNFDVKYDAQFIKENKISADFKAYNWLSRYDAYIPFSKTVERGVLHAGMARSKGKSTSGHGQVGVVRAVTEDNIAGFRGNDKTSLKFRLENVTMMGAGGQLIALPSAELEIPLELGKKADALKNEDLVLYPNPANDMINFHLNGVNTIEYVRLMDATGREITRLNNVNAKSASINVDASMRGFYIAEVMTEKGRVIKKVEIIK
jgi:hypothetical protein